MHKTEVSERLHEFEVLCRRRGLPLTVQRRVILEAVLKTDRHPTADQVFETVRGPIPGISRTTVYRVLDTLVRVGVIHRIAHPGSTARFDGDVKRHHHLVCVKCDRVFDVFDDALDGLPSPTRTPAGFQVSDYSVVYTGTCAHCRNVN